MTDDKPKPAPPPAPQPTPDEYFAKHKANPRFKEAPKREHGFIFGGEMISEMRKATKPK